MAVHTENLVDERICDCCQTDATRTADGTVILVYRDRTELEVRDISATRLEKDTWTAPAVVHDDAWVMPACPVNGPAVASSGNTVATAWFTGQGGKGQVYVGFSDDGGRSFGEPVRVDEIKPLGRVDVVLVDERTAIVSWLGQGEIRLRWIGPAGPLGPPRVVARTSESRASGFPRMVLFEDELFLAWTEPGDVSRVHAARIPQDAG